jgi:hypothetical protein
VVGQCEWKVGQLKSKATLEDGILVVQNAPTQFQVISEDGWIAIEVAGVCRSRTGGDNHEASKRRENFAFPIVLALSHCLKSRDSSEPQILGIGEELVKKQAKDGRSSRSEIRNDDRTPAS